MGISSAFRSVPYNSCIGGASASQHLYGTAADNRIARVSNSRARRLARKSQVHGIGCYRSQTHNHFDLRLDNKKLRSARHWWWPRRDRRGRELDSNGKPCWGERRRSSAARLSAGAEGASLVPTEAEVREFGRAGEPRHLEGAD
jgi:hypothetical protein